MAAFRALMVVIFIVITGYTAVVIADHGMNLLPVFFGDIAVMAWPGQFNVDFSCFLVLSGLWLAWRHHFSAAGLVLGVFGVFGGALFLSVYLFIVSFSTADMKELMLGKVRATA